jgi:hypothetical protein
MVPKPTGADAEGLESTRGNYPGASKKFLHLNGSIVKGLPTGDRGVQTISRKNTMACKSYALMIYSSPERDEMGGSKALN